MNNDAIVLAINGSSRTDTEAGAARQEASPALTPLLNHAAPGDKWALPKDGWCQIAPLGEYAHSSGVVQVIDAKAIEAMVAAFLGRAGSTGSSAALLEERHGSDHILVDYDHFSYQEGNASEAAGWITQLEARGDGLWGKVRWTPEGEAALTEGRYRFLSPVWLAGEVEQLGAGRIRPLRLDSAGLTNHPNLRGMVPLSNRSRGVRPPEENEADRKGMPLGPQPVARSPKDRSSAPGSGRLLCEKDGQAPGPSSIQLQCGNHAVIERKQRNIPMQRVLAELGLTADAGEEPALAAVQAIKNRATIAERRVAELESSTSELLASQVEADLTHYQNRIAPEKRESWKKALLSNRKEAIELLESTRASDEAAAAGGHSRGGSLLNSTRATHGPTGRASGSEAYAEQQRAEVLAYKNRHCCSFAQAWRAVKSERPELFPQTTTA